MSTRQVALPPTLAPRLIPREAAAAYVNLGLTTFDEMVKAGKMPRPKQLTGKRRAWDVRELDVAVDHLPTVGGPDIADATWDDPAHAT
jgi:predicted DNA-binding transcriptional regulator AlpA